MGGQVRMCKWCRVEKPLEDFPVNLHKCRVCSHKEAITKGVDFQIKHHQDFLKARSIDRIVQTEFFRVVWEDADEKRQQEAVSLIKKLCTRGLNMWLFGDFEGCSVRELRKIASANHVQNYCDMDKAELIHHFIEKGIKNGKDRRTSKSGTTNITSGGCTGTSDKCQKR